MFEKFESGNYFNFFPRKILEKRRLTFSMTESFLLAFYKNFADAYNNRGVCYQAIGKNSEAEKTSQKQRNLATTTKMKKINSGRKICVGVFFLQFYYYF